MPWHKTRNFDIETKVGASSKNAKVAIARGSVDHHEVIIHPLVGIPMDYLLLCERASGIRPTSS